MEMALVKKCDSAMSLYASADSRSEPSRMNKREKRRLQRRETYAHTLFEVRSPNSYCGMPPLAQKITSIATVNVASPAPAEPFCDSVAGEAMPEVSASPCHLPAGARRGEPGSDIPDRSSEKPQCSF